MSSSINVVGQSNRDWKGRNIGN